MRRQPTIIDQNQCQHDLSQARRLTATSHRHHGWTHPHLPSVLTQLNPRLAIFLGTTFVHRTPARALL